MFMSANGDHLQLVLDIAEKEKQKLRKKEAAASAAKMRKTSRASASSDNLLSSGTNHTATTSKGGDRKKPKGMFGFLKSKNTSSGLRTSSSSGGLSSSHNHSAHSRSNYNNMENAKFDTASTGATSIKSGATGKATEATQEVSMRSLRSKDVPVPPSPGAPALEPASPRRAPIAADASDANNNNNGEVGTPRRHRKRRTSRANNDVPKFLQVDQDESAAAAAPSGKKSNSSSNSSRNSGQRSVESGEEDLELEEGGKISASAELSTPKQGTKKKAAPAATTSSNNNDQQLQQQGERVPIVIQVDDDDEDQHQENNEDSPLDGAVDNSPKKKSILKTSKPEDLAVRTIPAVPLTSAPGGSNGGPPIEVNDTIFINDNGIEDDVITCITMEDFKDLAKKPKRRPKRISKKHQTGMSKKKSSSSSGGGDNESRGSRDSSGTLSDSRLAEILRKDIRSKNASTLITGLTTIAETATKGAKQRNKIVHFGALPSILQAIELHQVKNVDVVLSGLVAIQKITSKDTKHQVAICELGGIPTITSAMQVNMLKPDVVGAALKTLELITTCMRLPDDHDEDEDEDEFEDIPTKGAITVLSCCLMAHPKDKDILAYSFCALVNLCMNRPHMLQMLSESGGVPLMAAAVEQKWKSKSRKNQALEDLPIILESVDDDSEEESDSESESSEEEDSDDDDSDDDDDDDE